MVVYKINNSEWEIEMSLRYVYRCDNACLQLICRGRGCLPLPTGKYSFISFYSMWDKSLGDREDIVF